MIKSHKVLKALALLTRQVEKLNASNERLASDIARDRSFLETIPEADAKVTMLNGDLQVQQRRESG